MAKSSKTTFKLNLFSMKLIIEKNPEKRLSPKEKKQGVGKNFVYHQSHQPFIKIKVLVKDLEQEPEIYVNKIEKRLYKIPQLISLLRRFEETKKGIVMVHGGGVVNEGHQGILFGARQDIGKTTLILLLAKKGYSILGDDAINISQDGYLLRIQKEAGIYPHPNNLRDLPLSFKEKIVGWLKYHFFRNPPFCHLIYPNLRVPYSKIGKVADKVKLAKIFILEKGEPEIFEINEDVAINKFLATSFDLILPEGFVRRFFYSYCWANDISPNFIEKEYEKILNSAFNNRKIFVIKGRNPFDFYNLFLEHEEKQS